MLLALDIGNTEITLGLFAGSELEAHWRMTTNPDRTPDEWGSAVGAFLAQAGHSPNEIRAVCLASVAPAVTQSVVDGIARATGRDNGTGASACGIPITTALSPAWPGRRRMVTGSNPVGQAAARYFTQIWSSSGPYMGCSW